MGRGEVRRGGNPRSTWCGVAGRGALMFIAVGHDAHRVGMGRTVLGCGQGRGLLLLAGQGVVSLDTVAPDAAGSDCVCG